MKKIAVSFVFFALLAACTPVREQRWDRRVMTFSAEALQTRTVFSAVGEGGSINVSWSQGDTIGIWCSTSGRGNYPYMASPQKEDASRAVFDAVNEGMMFLYSGTPSTYYAYYPYNEGNDNTPVMTFRVPQSQVQAAAGDPSFLGGVQPFRSAPVNVSGSDAQASFAFTPVLSTVHLALKMDEGETIAIPVRRVKLVSKTAALSSCVVTLDLTKEDSSPVAVDGNNEVTLGFTTLPVLDKEAASDIWLAVLPGKHENGLICEVTAVDGSVATKSLPAVTFSGGNSYSCPLSFSVSDFVNLNPFDIIPSSLTAQAGVPVSFAFQGSAASVDFWSGEKFHDYEYKERERVEVSPLNVSFKHAISAGTQNNHPLLKLSHDFNGTMTEENILAATWEDISGNFTFATENLGTDNPITTNIATYEKYFVDSGEYDISSYLASGGAAYLAFFWHADKYDADIQNTRTVSYITRFCVGDWEMSAGTLSLVWDNDKWSGVSASNTPAWQTPKNTVPNYPAFRFMSEFRPASERDAYAVANEPFVADVNQWGYDTPLAVQGETEPTPAIWRYTFETPGVYEVVFEASCPTLSGDNTEIRKFTITVM